MVFSVLTHANFQKEPMWLKLESMKVVMDKYPLIERKFFDDLIEKTRGNQQYFVEAALLRVLNEQGKDLNADYWILLWGIDFKDRLFHILIERNPEYQGKGAIAAVGPAEFEQFISSMTHSGIMATLTLLNSPDKMKNMGVLVTRPPKYADISKDRQKAAGLARFKNWINDLKDTPNVRGQWFPTNKVQQCPLCNAQMVNVPGYEIAFGQLLCPQCGYSMKKSI